MMNTSRRFTLRDVAERSGVSYQTVSRVINNHPYVADGTRERVLQAIADLDYRPSKAAQSLAARRSQTLAILAFSMNHYGPAQMVINIERAARARGYDLILANVADTSAGSVLTAINSIRRWRVDGILWITPVPGTSYDEVVALCDGIPLVQIDAKLGSSTPSVVVDQRYGSYLATRHLIELGHTRICEISGPLNWFGAVDRHESWLATLREAGLQPGISVEGDWTAVGGYHAARRLLDEGADFTALVVGNDQMSLGALRALREAGLRVPEDVSVVGFDDIPEAACFEPPLTTIRQDFAQLGREGVEYLIERIGQPDSPATQRVIYPQFVQRLSATRPRG